MVDQVFADVLRAERTASRLFYSVDVFCYVFEKLLRNLAEQAQ
jgi:hypothetical protein